jgi:hypothetical protein
MTKEETIISNLYEAKKVELGTHKVELSNINDLEKVSADAKKNLADFKKQQADLKSTAKLLISSGDKFRENTLKINSMATELNKQFKELGLNYLDNASVKEAVTLLDQTFDVTNYTGLVKQINK